MTLGKQGLPDSTGSVYVRTHWECETMWCAQPAQVQARQNPGTENGTRKRNPNPNQEAISNWYLLGGRKAVSPVVCHWVCQPHSRAGPMPRNRWPIQMELLIFFFRGGFLGFFCCCCYFIEFFLVLDFHFCFGDLFERSERKRGKKETLSR